MTEIKMYTEKENYLYCKETMAIKDHIEESFIELGKRLLAIRDERKYEPYWSSFDEYLWEMKLDKSRSSKLINIYEKFVVLYKIPIKDITKAGGWTLLAETLPVVHSREEAEEWVAKAPDMRQIDIRKEVKEIQTGIDMSKCKHENAYVIRVCPDCGDRERIELTK